MVDRTGHDRDERADALDRFAQHLGRAAEVDAHVALALVAEQRTEVQRHLRVAEDPAGRVVAPAERGEVDPREESGIRDAIARAGNVLGEQVGEQPPVLVERREQAVEPRVALRRERRDRGEGAEQAGAPLDLGGQRAHDARGLLRRRDHQRALESGEVERLARAHDARSRRAPRRARREERRERDAGLHERGVDLVADHGGAEPAASSASAARLSRECTVPVGLCGLHSRTARAPPARAASMPSEVELPPGAGVDERHPLDDRAGLGDALVERRVHRRRDDHPIARAR